MDELFKLESAVLLVSELSTENQKNLTNALSNDMNVDAENTTRNAQGAMCRTAWFWTHYRDTPESASTLRSTLLEAVPDGLLALSSQNDSDDNQATDESNIRMLLGISEKLEEDAWSDYCERCLNVTESETDDALRSTIAAILQWRHINGDKATYSQLAEIVERATREKRIPYEARYMLHATTLYQQIVPLTVAKEFEAHLRQTYLKISAPETDLSDQAYAKQERYITTDRCSQEELIALKDMLAFEKPDSRPSRILLEGAAGSGKTTLCNTIVYHWAQRNDNMRELCDYKYVFLISFEELRRDASIAECIRAKMPNIKNNAAAIDGMLLRNRCLVIMDGFKNRDILQETTELTSFINCKALTNMTVLFTACDATQVGNFREETQTGTWDRVYKLHHITNEQIVRFNNLYFGTMQQPIFNIQQTDSQPTWLRTFLADPVYRGCIHQLHENTSQTDIASTTDLYRHIVEPLIKNTDEEMSSPESMYKQMCEYIFLFGEERYETLLPTRSSALQKMCFGSAHTILRLQSYLAVKHIVNSTTRPKESENNTGSPNDFVNMLPCIPEVKKSSTILFTVGLLSVDNRFDDIQAVFNTLVKPEVDLCEGTHETSNHFALQCMAQLQYNTNFKEMASLVTVERVILSPYFSCTTECMFGASAVLKNVHGLHVKLTSLQDNLVCIMASESKLQCFEKQLIAFGPLTAGHTSAKLAWHDILCGLRLHRNIEAIYAENLRLKGSLHSIKTTLDLDVYSLTISDCDVTACEALLDVTQESLESLTLKLTIGDETEIHQIVQKLPRLQKLHTLNINCSQQVQSLLMQQIIPLIQVLSLRSFTTTCNNIQECILIEDILINPGPLKHLCISNESNCEYIPDVLINYIMKRGMGLKQVDLNNISKEDVRNLWDSLTEEEKSKCQWLEINVGDENRNLQQLELDLPRLPRGGHRTEEVSSQRLNSLAQKLPIFMADRVVEAFKLTRCQSKKLLSGSNNTLARIYKLHSYVWSLDTTEQDAAVQRLKQMLKPIMRKDVVDWDGIIEVCRGFSWRTITWHLPEIDTSVRKLAKQTGVGKVKLFYKAVLHIANKRPGFLDTVTGKLCDLLPPGYRSTILETIRGDKQSDPEDSSYDNAEAVDEETTGDGVLAQISHNSRYGKEARACNSANDEELLGELLEQTTPERQDLSFIGEFYAYENMNTYFEKHIDQSKMEPIGIAILDTDLCEQIKQFRPDIEHIIYTRYGKAYFEKTNANAPPHGTIVAEIIHRYAACAHIKIYHYNVMNRELSGSSADIHEALQDVSSKDDVSIVNLSLGMSFHTNDMRKILQEVGQTKVIVAAAGNDEQQDMETIYPAQNDMVIPIGAWDYDDSCAAADVHIYCPSVSSPNLRSTSYAAAHASAFAAIALRVASIMDKEDEDRYKNQAVNDTLAVRLVYDMKWDEKQLKSALNIPQERVEAHSDFHRYYVLLKIIQDKSIRPSAKKLSVILKKACAELIIPCCEHTEIQKHPEELCWQVAKHYANMGDFEAIAVEIRKRTTTDETKRNNAEQYVDDLLRPPPRQDEDLGWHFFISFWLWMKKLDRKATAEYVYEKLVRLYPSIDDVQKQRIKNICRGQSKVATLKHAEAMRRLMVKIYDAKPAAPPDSRGTANCVSGTMAANMRDPCECFHEYVKNDFELLRKIIVELNMYNYFEKEG